MVQVRGNFLYNDKNKNSEGGLNPLPPPPLGSTTSNSSIVVVV